MSETLSYILVLDEKDRVRPIIETAVEKSFLVENVLSFSEAKKRIIVDPPSIIFVKISFSKESAISFVRELKSHPSFAKIPVLLLADEVSADLIKQADAAGAKGLLAWPTPVSMLKNRIKNIANLEVTLSGDPQHETESRVAPNRNSPAQGVGNEEKIEIAKQILALVLNNIKTSALLEVVQKEDIPKLVYEITRTICFKNPSAK